MPTVVVIPVAFMENITAWPKSVERVRALVDSYQAGRIVPPIPVHLSQRGALRLERDGNHRLQAARESGLPTVEVSIDQRDSERLKTLIAQKETTP